MTYLGLGAPCAACGARLYPHECRSEERVEAYWRQLERAQQDVAEWPQFVRDAFPDVSFTGKEPS